MEPKAYFSDRKESFRFFVGRYMAPLKEDDLDENMSNENKSQALDQIMKLKNFFREQLDEETLNSTRGAFSFDELNFMGSMYFESVDFKLDDEILENLKNIDSDYRKLNLPFESIFIDNYINFEGIDGTIDGIFIKQLPSETLMAYVYRKDNVPFLLFHSIEDAFDKSQELEFFNKRDDKNDLKDFNIMYKVSSLVLSFLNFLYNPEVSIIKKEYSEIRKKRKMQEGKIVRDYNKLKVTGKTRKYIYEFYDKIQELGSNQKSCIVRGHYRHLQNDRFTNKKGQVIFIPPYIKGDEKEVESNQYSISKKREWKNEELMKGIIRKMFPNEIILENTRGFLEGLEIDCYIPRLRLGFEYNGKQHYNFVEEFHKSKESLKNQIKRDKEKNRIAKEKGIYLVTIKYDEPLTFDNIKSKLYS